MEIDVLHRHDLRIAATGRAAFHAERRPERRLAQAQHRLLANVIERIGKPDCRRGLTLAGRRWRDRRYEDELAVRPVLQGLDVVDRYLGFVVAVRLKVFGRDAEPFAGHVGDQALGGSLRNLDVRFRADVLGGWHRGFLRFWNGEPAFERWDEEGSRQACTYRELRGSGKFSRPDLAAVGRFNAQHFDTTVGAHDSESVGLDGDDFAQLAADSLGIARRQRSRLEYLKLVAVEHGPGAGRRIAAA